MICWLTNLIGAVLTLGLVLAGFVYMVSPKHGGELLRRLAIFFVLAIAGICLLRQYAAYIGPFSVLLIIVILSVAAYFIREARMDRPQRQLHPKGAERTPILPPNEEEQP